MIAAVPHTLLHIQYDNPVAIQLPQLSFVEYRASRFQGRCFQDGPLSRPSTVDFPAAFPHHHRLLVQKPLLPMELIYQKAKTVASVLCFLLFAICFRGIPYAQQITVLFPGCCPLLIPAMPVAPAFVMIVAKGHTRQAYCCLEQY